MALPATSGTTAYTQSAYKLIRGALQLCNAIDEDETPTASMAQNGMDVLNAMVKGWQASGIHVWCQEEAILFLQPGQPQYKLGAGSPDRACLYDDFTQTAVAITAAAGASSLSVSSAAGLVNGAYIGVQVEGGVNFWTTVAGNPAGVVIPLAAPLPAAAASGALVFSYVTPLIRPLRVPEGRRYRYDSKIQTPLIVLARFDYDYLPNLYSRGTVTQFFYDPQTGNGVYSEPIGLMKAWPTPSDNSSAMRFVSQRPIQAFVTLANIPDFPAEWLAAIRWNLAVEMAPEYDVPADRFDRLKGQADTWFLRVSAWDKEPEPVLFGMAMNPGYR